MGENSECRERTWSRVWQSCRGCGQCRDQLTLEYSFVFVFVLRPLLEMVLLGGMVTLSLPFNTSLDQLEYREAGKLRFYFIREVEWLRALRIVHRQSRQTRISFCAGTHGASGASYLLHIQGSFPKRFL